MTNFDEKHEFIPENTDLRDEKRDIILNYQKDEAVKLMIFPAEMLQITEMHLYDKDKKEPAFSWDYETEKLDFFMPETNLRLDMKLEERYPVIPEDSYYTEDALPSTDWGTDLYGEYDMGEQSDCG